MNHKVDYVWFEPVEQWIMETAKIIHNDLKKHQIKALFAR